MNQIGLASMSDTIQELYGRKGRTVTDRDAQEITRVEELAYDLKISEVMTRDVKSLSPGDTMRSMIDLLRQNHISGATVMDGDALVGVVSQEDLMRALADHDRGALINKYMSKNVITVKSDEPVVKAP